EQGATVDQAEIARREAGLHQALTRAQVVMIGLGGAIGTGLFMGSGTAIGYAGPAVIVSYAIAGFAAVVMVFSLSEMAVVHPTAGSFGTYAEIYLNPWAGTVVRSEEHTSELQSPCNLVCRLLLEKKKKKKNKTCE